MSTQNPKKMGSSLNLELTPLTHSGSAPTPHSRSGSG